VLGREPRPADPFVIEALRVLGSGWGRSALDLASGTGRHALELAALGYATSAWDVSGVALEILSQRARARGLSVATRRLDLAVDPLPAERFDVVVIVDYLDRALYARLPELLAPAGHAIITTFTEDWPAAHPSARFRLARGELERAVPRGEIQVVERDGRAGVVWRSSSLGR
jgi:SAM-dependent methyltransferase